MCDWLITEQMNGQADRHEYLLIKRGEEAKAPLTQKKRLKWTIWTTGLPTNTAIDLLSSIKRQRQTAARQNNPSPHLHGTCTPIFLTSTPPGYYHYHPVFKQPLPSFTPPMPFSTHQRPFCSPLLLSSTSQLPSTTRPRQSFSPSRPHSHLPHRHCHLPHVNSHPIRVHCHLLHPTFLLSHAHGRPIHLHNHLPRLPCSPANPLSHFLHIYSSPSYLASFTPPLPSPTFPSPFSTTHLLHHFFFPHPTHLKWAIKQLESYSLSLAIFPSVIGFRERARANQRGERKRALFAINGQILSRLSWSSASLWVNKVGQKLGM